MVEGGTWEFELCFILRLSLNIGSWILSLFKWEEKYKKCAIQTANTKSYQSPLCMISMERFAVFQATRLDSKTIAVSVINGAHTGKIILTAYLDDSCIKIYLSKKIDYAMII